MYAREAAVMTRRMGEEAYLSHAGKWSDVVSRRVAAMNEASNFNNNYCVSQTVESLDRSLFAEKETYADDSGGLRRSGQVELAFYVFGVV